MISGLYITSLNCLPHSALGTMIFLLFSQHSEPLKALLSLFLNTLASHLPFTFYRSLLIGHLLSVTFSDFFLCLFPPSQLTTIQYDGYNLFFDLLCISFPPPFWGPTHGMQKFPGQESNLPHSSSLSCCSDNARSLT